MLCFSAPIILLVVVAVMANQNGGYYCVKSSDLLHIDFRLDPADDNVNQVYANAEDSTPLPNCLSEYDSSTNMYHLRITINTTSQEQISPTSSCGFSFSAGVYTIRMTSYAASGLVSSSDRLFTIKCEGTSETNTVGTVTVGSVDHITMSSDIKASLTAVSVPDLKDLSTSPPQLGDKVKLKFTLTFNSAIENVDIIGARLKNLVVSPYDSYWPINRTLIDNNGCAVNHSENVLELSGPFETASNGSSPFIAYTPEMEIAKFSGSIFLYVIVSVEYCYNTECFTDMCSTRRKRNTNTDAVNIVSQFSIEVVDPPFNTGSDPDKECYEKSTFVAVISTILIFVTGEIVILLIVMKKLYEIKSKVLPSPDISFEKLPLYDVYYHNPINGYHPPRLQNHIGPIVL